jgi:alpha-methylacyl-CoA racemase
MVDGAALFTGPMHGRHADGLWSDAPGTNLLDSGAHFYEVYRASDGVHLAVGAIEPQFYRRLLELLEIPVEQMPQWDRERWPEFKRRLAALFATRDAVAWAELLEREDTCVTVIRGPFEAPADPHLAARETFVDLGGVVQPAPAPRFSRTAAQATPAQHDVTSAVARWGLDARALGLE